MRLSFKFYGGIIITILSFIVGKVATAIFFLYYADETPRLLAIALYFISWVMLFWGIWWVGQEYYGKIRKYVGIRYYHEKAKHHSQAIKAKVKEKITQRRPGNHKK